MIIQLENNIPAQQKESIVQQIKDIKYKITEVHTQYADYLIAIGKNEFDIRKFGHLPGIKDIHIVSDTYKLVSRKWKVQPTTIDLGDGVSIGEGSLAIMSGPCSIESEAQILSMVNHLKENGVRIMRGGVFKPRSS